MINLDFYKEFYFREIDRKNTLESKINLPILILTLLVSFHAFLLSQNLEGWFLTITYILTSINFLAFLAALYFLAKSYSNLFYSHWYKELAVMDDILDYEKKLIEENLDNKEEIILNYLKNELANCSSENFKLNKKRTENLAKCKQWLFIILLFSGVLGINYIVFLILN